METMKKLSLADVRRYCRENRYPMLTVNDFRNRRAVTLNFSERPIEENSISCLVCTSHKHGEQPDESNASFQNAFYYKVFQCVDKGLSTLLRIEVWGGFSLSTLFNAGDTLFDRRKPCRTYLVTAPQWAQMRKHMGDYDKITAPHEAFSFERLAYEGGRAWVDQTSVCIPEGYKWKL